MVLPTTEGGHYRKYRAEELQGKERVKLILAASSYHMPEVHHDDKVVYSRAFSSNPHMKIK